MYKFVKASVVTWLAGASLGMASLNASADHTWSITDQSFKCILHMTKVGDFYVDNLIGNLAATVAVANAGQGQFPEGSVLQVMPNEVMVKRHAGFSPDTNDWEFLFIDVDKSGAKIFTRGTKDVNNRLGMNCFECHSQARPEFDLVCKSNQGCAPLPVTKAMFAALQRTDPRCPDAHNVSAEDQEALRQLGEVIKALTANTAPAE